MHGRWALVMPEYEHGTLSHPRRGHLAQNALPRVVRGVASALEHMHRAGCIHGDVKV